MIASLLVFIIRKKYPIRFRYKNNIIGLDDILILFSIAIEKIQYL